jgi:hypothetical protein
MAKTSLKDEIVGNLRSHLKKLKSDAEGGGDAEKKLVSQNFVRDNIINEPPKNQRLTVRHKFTLDDIPHSIKLASPVYLFVKTVAGILAIENFEIYFDMRALESVFKSGDLTIHTSCVQGTVLSACIAIEELMQKVSQNYFPGKRPLSWERAILPKLKHPLWFPFANMVAVKMRKNFSQKNTTVISTRNQISHLIIEKNEQKVFCKQVYEYLRSI